MTPAMGVIVFSDRAEGTECECPEDTLVGLWYSILLRLYEFTISQALRES
jgi:hypothetical protein